MFYELEIKDHIRVDPKSFNEDVEASVLKSLIERFEGYISEELGFVIGISEIQSIGEGIITPGDGAAYYETTFIITTFKPEIHETIVGKITDITEFGAFIDMGPADGMIHISQTMDDFVSLSKEKVLTGKESKKILKVNDICRARIVAISYKDTANPKIGLTMRQPLLGNIKWIEEELKEAKKGK
ncbi:MAG: DNA-directed RNA polymerase [Candidatus Woesearchaeota archaeon]